MTGAATLKSPARRRAECGPTASSPAYSCEIAYFDDVEQAADLCRVRAISPDRRQLYLESRNGQVASVSADTPFDFDVGTVLLVRVADNHLEPAPASLWLEETWVGVVRLRLHDVPAQCGSMPGGDR